MAEKNASEIEKLKSTNRLLIIALVIGAFFLGSLSNQISLNKKTNTQTSPDANSQAPSAPSAAQKPKDITNKDHIRGNKNAKITLIEYSDFECPFCKSFSPTLSEIMKIYGDKIRLVYRHFPLDFHANAQKEAEASECIAELGGNDVFWKYVDAIFERTISNGTGFALDKLGPLASELGVDQVKFQSCLDSGKYEKFVKDSIAEGSAAGVSGTPSTFLVNAKGEAKIIVGAQPIDAFKTAIDSALK